MCTCTTKWLWLIMSMMFTPLSYPFHRGLRVPSVLVSPTHGPVSCGSESGLLPITRENGPSQAKFQHMIFQCCFKDTPFIMFNKSNIWMRIKSDGAIVQLYMKCQPFIKNIIEGEISEVKWAPDADLVWELLNTQAI